MKAFLALAASAPVLLATGQTSTDVAALEPPAPPQALGMPGYAEPAREWRDLEEAAPDRGTARGDECRDRIRQAREELGQPELQREPADADKPLLIWAVDRRLDGCGVMVMKGDAADIRPVPDPPEGPLLKLAQ